MYEARQHKEPTSRIIPSSTRNRLIQLCKCRNHRNAVLQRNILKINKIDNSEPTTGKMDYSFKWKATEPHLKGYIVQNIIRKETNESDKIDKNRNYWEAWEVINGVICNQGKELPETVQHDTWYNHSMPPGSKGHIIMNGHIYFANKVEKMDVKEVMDAGDLLSSKEKPQLTNETDIGEETYTYYWNRQLVDDNINRIIDFEVIKIINMESELTLPMTEDDFYKELMSEVNANDPQDKPKVDLETIKNRVRNIFSNLNFEKESDSE